MQFKSRKSLGLGVATGVLALALSGLPISVGFDHGPFDGKAALAAAGGNGKGHGNANANGHAKGLEADGTQTANTASTDDELAKDKLAKTDPMHPSNLGRLNGFMHASPQALASASPNSAIGTLSKTYKDALLGYTGTAEEVPEEAITEEDLAEILAEAANKPLTGEQVVAIHEKLIAANPELAEEAVAAQLTDEDFADELADEANEIQATEANQGLGGEEDEADEDADDVADSDDTDDAADESDGVVADAADTVADAAVDTADAIGDFFDETF
jgi:hypothetical protein